VRWVGARGAGAPRTAARVANVFNPAHNALPPSDSSSGSAPRVPELRVRAAGWRETKAGFHFAGWRGRAWDPDFLRT
jgi:hypothetical protein